MTTPSRAALAAMAISIGAVILASVADAGALAPDAIFKTVAPSVWVVKAIHSDKGDGAQGSAVVVGRRSLVTACHVVKGAISVTVTHSGGAEQAAVLRTTTDPDPRRDLCVLTTEVDIGAPAVAIAPLDTVHVGDPAYAIGSPLGLELTLTSGLVSGLRTDDHGVVNAIQASAVVTHGSSGGGLFDKEGRLMGVTVASANETSQALGFAVPAEVLLDLPERRKAELDRWIELLTQNGITLDSHGDPAPSGYAAIDDLSALPRVGPREGIETAYKQYLLAGGPRAFVVTSDHQWGTVTSVEQMQAIMAQCHDRKVQCAVYAVNKVVVWKGSGS
jgi:S1-C subfamily serine protease